MLVFLERIKASRQVPWDYDLYCIVENDLEVGRLVFRYGSDEQLKYCGHVGYHIDEEYRGHHYAYQALQDLFQIISLDEIILSCDLDNIASQKTIEKCKILEKKRVEEIDDPEYCDGLYIYRVKKS